MTSDVAAVPSGSRSAPAGATPVTVDHQLDSVRASVTMDGQPFPIRPHHCFACGATNVQGIGLPLHIEGDSCWTEIVLPDRFEGWEGIAHGGIVCTILDEVMAWSLAHRDTWGLTARMTVDFRRPVPIGLPLRGEGRLVRARRRLMETEARLLDAQSGEVLATADAVYVAAPPDRKADLKRRYGFDDRPLQAGPAEVAGQHRDPRSEPDP